MRDKNSFLNNYSAFWKKTFDFRSVSSLKEYWQPVGLHIGLAALAIVFYVISRDEDWAKIPFWILTAFLTVSLLPFAAVSVRRLRDTGLSGLWALLLLFVGAGTCVVLCLCAAGSSFLPWDNRPVPLYGPPPFVSTAAADPLNTDPFDPSKNEPVDVYGPPEWFEGQTVKEEEPFDPSTTTVEPLYGTPAWNDEPQTAKDPSPENK